MTLNTPALTLFASTIASGLGLSLATSAFTTSGSDVALLIGLALLLIGPATFVGVASRIVQRDTAMIRTVLVAFLTGVLSIWFWLVPAKTGVMTGACVAGKLSACAAVAQGGGFPAQIAHTNDAFVVAQCEQLGRPEYCRLAAAKRLSHPTRFCTSIDPRDGFEVVEWCTPARGWDGLVARR